MTGLVNGESYTWKVSAYNDQGFGNYSDVSSVGIPGTLKAAFLW